MPCKAMALRRSQKYITKSRARKKEIARYEVYKRTSSRLEVNRERVTVGR